jgi:hypothetical protein
VPKQVRGTESGGALAELAGGEGVDSEVALQQAWQRIRSARLQHAH